MKISFSKHAAQRMCERGIQKEEVVSAVLASERVEKRHGKFYAKKKTARGLLEVVFERKSSNLIVVTVYWL